MALKLSYAAQTDIPEAHREFYVEHEGNWRLDTDPSTDDNTKAVAALNQERGLRRDAEKQLTELKVKFEGIDPEEHHKLQDRVKGLDDAEVYDKQGIEVLVTRRTESMKAEHDRQVQAKDREITQLRGQATESDRKWRQDRIKTALLDAVSKSGVYEKAIEDAVQYGCGVFTDLDTDGLPVAKRGDDVTYGKDGINALRPEEWISTVKTSGAKPHWWLPSSGGGAPGHHTANGQQTDWSKLPPAERLTAFRQQQEAQRNR